MQQIHLQDSLFCTHGLHGKVLGADDGEFGLFSDLEIIIRRGDREGFCLHALGKASLVLQDLALDVTNGGINSAAHIAIGLLRLGTEQGACTANRDLHRTQVIFLYRKGDVGGSVLVMQITLQLGDLLFSILLDGIVQRDFLTNVSVLH